MATNVFVLPQFCSFALSVFSTMIMDGTDSDKDNGVFISIELAWKKIHKIICKIF